MATYNNSIVLQFDDIATGNAGADKFVTVYITGTSIKPDLTDVGLNPISNPVQADDEGNYTFTLDSGNYDLVIDENLVTEVKIVNENISDGLVSQCPAIEEERQILSQGQTTVNTISVDLNTASIHVSSPSIDSRKLELGLDYSLVDPKEITLISSFPSGTIFSATGAVVVSSSTTKSGNFATDAALPEHAMSFDFSFSDEPDQGMQGVDIDIENSLVYISQNIKAGGVSSYDPEEMLQLAVFDYKTDGSTVAANSFSPQIDVGHGQDLSLEKDGSTIYLWTSAKTPSGAGGNIINFDGDVEAKSNVDAGRSVARIEYKGGLTTNADITEFRVMAPFDEFDQDTWFYRCTPKVSTCGKYIVAKLTNMKGIYLQKILVWFKSDIEAGVYQNPIADFFVTHNLVNTPDLAVVQGVNLHNDIIYVQTGFVDPLINKRILRYTLNGSFIDSYDYYADVSYLAGVETTVEPEGTTFTIADGELKMAMAFNTKSSTENVKCLQIYGTGSPVEHEIQEQSIAHIEFSGSKYDMTYRDGEALAIYSYNYSTEIATEAFRINSSFEASFTNTLELSMKKGRVLKYLEVTDPLRDALLIRVNDTLASGAGINIYGDADPSFPGAVLMITPNGGGLRLNDNGDVFLADVTAEPPTPTGGVVFYSQAGSYKVKGSSGTVTVLGVA